MSGGGAGGGRLGLRVRCLLHLRTFFFLIFYIYGLNLRIYLTDARWFSMQEVEQLFRKILTQFATSSRKSSP
jgi:hypothetical protein